MIANEYTVTRRMLRFAKMLQNCALIELCLPQSKQNKRENAIISKTTNYSSDNQN